MQVTHSSDHITHALIGGNKTIEFGISNDAAFFQILSSTLYSDQRLAVAREVLCNAWDAHIRAGITDKPIEVTITDSKITVRDRAFGIAPDMMGPKSTLAVKRVKILIETLSNRMVLESDSFGLPKPSWLRSSAVWSNL